MSGSPAELHELHERHERSLRDAIRAAEERASSAAAVETVLVDLFDRVPRLSQAEELRVAEALLPSAGRIGGSGPWTSIASVLSYATWQRQRRECEVMNLREALEDPCRGTA